MKPDQGTGEFTDEPTLDVPRNRIPAAHTHDISSHVTTLTVVARMRRLIASGSSAMSRPGWTPIFSGLARPGRFAGRPAS
jgi:hypothetical protein